MKFYNLFVLWGLFAFAGCGDQTPGIHIGTEKSFASLRGNDVIVQVNSEKITKKDIETYSQNVGFLIKRRKPGISNKILERMTNRYLQQAPFGFVDNILLYQEALKSGIEISNSDIEKYNANFLKVNGAKKQSFDEFCKDISPEGKTALAMQMQLDRFIAAYKEKLRAKIIISEDQIDETLEKIKKYNEGASATNTLVFATATNVWNELKAGADFMLSAAKHSVEFENEEGVFGEFTLDELKTVKGLKQAVENLKSGEFTPPFECDNGLMIVKVLGDNRKSGVKTTDEDDEKIKLGRIFFSLPEFYEIPSREEVSDTLRTRQFTADLKNLLETLKKQAYISYPNGTNWFNIAK